MNALYIVSAFEKSRAHNPDIFLNHNSTCIPVSFSDMWRPSQKCRL